VPRRKAPNPRHRVRGAEVRTDADLAGRLIAPEANRDSRQLQAERLHWASVYDGRQCIGHLISRGKLGVEAFDVENRSLGIFPSVKQALAAFDGGAP
jgi:hypothetical protein